MTTSESKQVVLRDKLAAAKPRVVGMLPTTIPEAMRERVSEKMLRVALLAATKQPKLYDCSPESVVNSVVAAASLGLELGGVLGEAYLVPYGNQCTLVPGYRGLVKLACQDGAVKSIEARVVYKDDMFHVAYGTQPRVMHEPALASRNRADADIVAAYMVARLANGEVVFDVMTREEIEKVRAVSRGKDSGPWRDWYPEQCKKTVVKRGVKLLPLSPEAGIAVELDNRAEVGQTGNTIPEIDDPGSSSHGSSHDRSSALRERIKSVKGELEAFDADGGPEAEA